jgi:hypothetical protein
MMPFKERKPFWFSLYLMVVWPTSKSSSSFQRISNTENSSKTSVYFSKKSLVQRGAAQVELSFIFPLFIILSLFLIDVARYFYYSLIFNYAAFSAADYASKKPLEVSIRESYCLQPGNESKCLQFFNDFSSIADKAERILRFAGVEIAESADKYMHFDPALYQTNYSTNIYTNSLQFPPSRRQRRVAVIRPGEFAMNVRDGSRFSYPFSGVTWPDAAAGGSTWDTSLRANPVVVHAEARMKTLFPLWGPFRISATQVGYRKPPTSGVSSPTNPTPSPSPSPPPPTPSPSPSPLFTPTPRPTLTSTPRPNPTTPGARTPTRTPTQRPNTTPTPVVNTPTPAPTVNPCLNNRCLSQRCLCEMAPGDPICQCGFSDCFCDG